LHPNRLHIHYHQRMHRMAGESEEMMGRKTLAAIAFLALAAGLALPQPRIAAQAAVSPAPTPQSSSHPRDASLDDYRAHLIVLNGFVQSCAKARDMKTCDPALVGPDDEVPVSPAPNAERRLVRYGWLRVLLSQAQDKDAPPPKIKPALLNHQESWEDVRPAPPTTTQLLIDAQKRLAAALAQAGVAPPPLSDHAQERAVMKQVLAGSEYSGLEEIDPKDSALEKVGNWLNNVLLSMMKASARAPWLGRLLVWGFIAAVCVALVWGLLQLERRWRILHHPLATLA
jgi:hypothetical protein